MERLLARTAFLTASRQYLVCNIKLPNFQISNKKPSTSNV